MVNAKAIAFMNEVTANPISAEEIVKRVEAVSGLIDDLVACCVQALKTLKEV